MFTENGWLSVSENLFCLACQVDNNMSFFLGLLAECHVDNVSFSLGFV